MSIEPNKAIVRRYFEEVVDKSKLDILGEIVSTDCIIHRPEASEPDPRTGSIQARAEKSILKVCSEFTTTIHDLIAEEDRVACRLSHRAVNRGEMDESPRSPRGGRKDGQLASNRNFPISRRQDCRRMGFPEMNLAC